MASLGVVDGEQKFTICLFNNSILQGLTMDIFMSKLLNNHSSNIITFTTQFHNSGEDGASWQVCKLFSF